MLKREILGFVQGHISSLILQNTMSLLLYLLKFFGGLVFSTMQKRELKCAKLSIKCSKTSRNMQQNTLLSGAKRSAICC